MKKSKLPEVIITSEAVEKFLNQLRMGVPSLKEYNSYGVQPVVDHFTNEVISYESLGDPNDCKTEVERFQLGDTVLELPVSTSQYVITTDKGEIKKTCKTLNMSSSEVAKVAKLYAETARLFKFLVEHISIPLRVITPDLQDLDVPAWNSKTPIFGKSFGDLWTGYPGGTFKSDAEKKNLFSMTGSIHLHHGLKLSIIDSEIAIGETIYEILKERHRLSNNVSSNASVVSQKNFVPNVVKDEVKTVNVTEFNNNNYNIGRKMENKYVMNMSENIVPQTETTKKK